MPHIDLPPGLPGLRDYRDTGTLPAERLAAVPTLPED